MLRSALSSNVKADAGEEERAQPSVKKEAASSAAAAAGASAASATAATAAAASAVSSSSSASGRASKRVKKEVVKKEEEEDDEEESEGEEEEKKGGSSAALAAGQSALASSAPKSVDLQRVRLAKPNGELAPLGGKAADTPWRNVSAASAAAPSSSSTAAAAAASSSSAAAAASAGSAGRQSVVYWMTREHRVEDNWSLLYAQELALRRDNSALRVVFSLVPKYLDATERHYKFMLSGLAEVESSLRGLGIPFEVLVGPAYDTLPSYVAQHAAGAVVTDFGPLRISKEWVQRAAAALGPTPLLVVDAHNVVPLWVASDKLEYAARTIRPKIHRHLKQFLTEFPKVKQQRQEGADLPPKTDWDAVDATLQIDRRVKVVPGIKPGTAAGLDTLHAFIRARLAGFATKRNDPNANHISGMSPYLHFGQVAPQRCVLEVNKFRAVSSHTT